MYENEEIYDYYNSVNGYSQNINIYVPRQELSQEENRSDNYNAFVPLSRSLGFEINTIAVHREKRIIAVGGLDTKVLILNTSDLQIIGDLKCKTGAVYSLAFSSDGKTLAVGGEKNIELWGVDDLRPIKEFEGYSGKVVSLMFTFSDNYLVSGANDNLIIYRDIESGRVIRNIYGQINSFFSLALSPNGRLLASGGYRLIYIWDNTTGRLIKRIKAHNYSITSLAFHPSCDFLISSSFDMDDNSDNEIKIWDLNTFKLVRTIERYQDKAKHIAFSPSGDIIASWGSNNQIYFYRFADGHLIKKINGWGSNLKIEFLNNEQIICGGWDRNIRILDINDKSINIIAGHTDWVNSVRFSPDCKYLATGSWDNTAKLWDMKDKGLARTFIGHEHTVSMVTFSPDGKLLATGSFDKTIKIWDVATGELIRTLIGHEQPIFSVSFSPDGKLLVSGSFDKTIRLWNVENGSFYKLIQSGNVVFYNIIFNTLGTMIIYCCKSEEKLNKTAICFADINTDKIIKTLDIYDYTVKTMDISSDDSIVVVGCTDGKIVLWDIENDRLLMSINADTNGINSVKFSPDHNTIVSCGSDNKIIVWDKNNGKPLREYFVHNDSVNSFDISLDGHMIACGGNNGSLFLMDNTEKIMNLDSSVPDILEQSNINIFRFKIEYWLYLLSIDISSNGEILAVGWNCFTVLIIHLKSNFSKVLSRHTGSVKMVKFSPDGKLLASYGEDGRIIIWNPITGDFNTVLDRFFEKNVSVVFSPDSKLLVSFSEPDTNMIWDTKSGALLYKLDKTCNNEKKIAFSPDNKLIAFCTDDNKIHLWDSSLLFENESIDCDLVSKNKDRIDEVLIRLSGHDGSINLLKFSPDSAFLMSCSQDKTTIIWNCQTGTLLSTLEKEISDVDFRQDGKLLVFGNALIELWTAPDVYQSQNLFKEPKDLIYSIPFNYSKNFAVTGDNRQLISFYNGVLCLSSINGNEKLFCKRLSIINGLMVYNAKYNIIVCTGMNDYERPTIYILSVDDILNNKFNIKDLKGNYSYFANLFNFYNNTKINVLPKADKTQNLLIDGASVEEIVQGFDKNIIIYKYKDHIAFYDLSCWSLIDEFEPTSKISHTCFAFSKNGHRYIIVHGSTIYLWNLLDKSLIGTYSSKINDITKVKLSADGEFFICANETQFEVWDASKSKILTFCFVSNSFDDKNLEILDEQPDLNLTKKDVSQLLTEITGVGKFENDNSIDSISEVEFCPNGTYFAVLRSSGFFELYSFESNIIIRVIASSNIFCFAFSNDGKMLAISEGYGIEIWETEKLFRKDVIKFSENSLDGIEFIPLNNIMFNPNSSLVVFNSSDNTIVLHSILENDNIFLKDCYNNRDIVFCKNGSKLASRIYHERKDYINICNTSDGQLIKSILFEDILEGSFDKVPFIFSDDGNTLIVGTKRLTFWDISNLK